MRKDWDLRARENAIKYVAPSADWEEFEESGKLDAMKLLSGLEHLPMHSMRALDIGCGIGRMERYLSGLFLEVHGVDVSLEMIKRGRERLKDYENVFLHLNSGYNLGLFRDRVFDFVFSYITFQHMPRKIVSEYFKEVYRVLKNNGIFKFQVLGLRIPRRLYTYIRRVKNFSPSLPCEPSDNDTWSLRFYSTKELRAMLTLYGFTDIKVLSVSKPLSVISVIWVTCRRICPESP